MPGSRICGTDWCRKVFEPRLCSLTGVLFDLVSAYVSRLIGIEANMFHRSYDRQLLDLSYFPDGSVRVRAPSIRTACCIPKLWRSRSLNIIFYSGMVCMHIIMLRFSQLHPLPVLPSLAIHPSLFTTHSAPPPQRHCLIHLLHLLPSVDLAASRLPSLPNIRQRRPPRPESATGFEREESDEDPEDEDEDGVDPAV